MVALMAAQMVVYLAECLVYVKADLSGCCLAVWMVFQTVVRMVGSLAVDLVEKMVDRMVG